MPHLHHGTPHVAARKVRRRGDRLVSHIRQQIHITALTCDSRQFLLCIQRSRIQLCRLTKARLRQVAIALRQRRLAQPVLDEGILWRIFGAQSARAFTASSGLASD